MNEDEPRGKSDEKATPIGRRKLLKVAVAGGAVALVGSVVAWVRTSGYSVSAQREAKLVALSASQLVFVEHAARRIVAPDVPGDASVPSADEVDVAGFVDRYVAEMHPTVRRDLLRFFTYVEHVAPLRIGESARFTRLPAADQDRVLASIESAREGLLRGGFDGLRSLVFMGYYRDARTWQILGYAGPMVNRPPGGWR